MKLTRLFVIGIILCGFGLTVEAQTEKRSVEGLIFDLQHPDAERREVAAQLLGQNDIHEAVPVLKKLNRDPQESVRLAALQALLEINDPRALPTFIESTRDASHPIQKLAIEGIVQSYVVEEGGFIAGVKKVVDFVNPVADGFDPLSVEPYVNVSRDAIAALENLLRSSEKDIREESAKALGVLRAYAALSAIEDALARETNDSVKVALIRAIYKIGAPSAGEAVVPFIRDPSKKVHDEAIFTVGRLRIREAAPPLNEMYRSGIEERKKIFGIVPVSGTDDLQKKVLEALANIGDPSSIDIFRDALEDERNDYRQYAAEGLGRVGDSQYLQILARKYMREESKRVKMALSYALFRLGREEHLLELVTNANDSEQAYYYLLELEPDQIRLLYPHVRVEDKDVKVALLEVIGQKGGPSGLDIAEEMSQHEDSDIVSAATIAIRRIRGRYPDA